jgi:hypothetical protein
MLDDRILYFHRPALFADPNRLPAPGACRWAVTSDKRELFNVRCVVFHLPSLLPEEWDEIRALRKIKPRHQVWVADSQESAGLYPLLDDPSYMSLFDFEMSYRQSADIWTPYFPPDFLDRMRAAAPRPKDGRCCVFISSDWDQSGRRRLVDELMDHLDVASYGQYRRNRWLARDEGNATKLEVIARYTFTLAFENSIAPDYVTEKFFQPFLAGSVPVYLGAPNVGEFAPGENAYVDVADFGSVRELADYLRTVDEGVHHAWREHPVNPVLAEKVSRHRVDTLEALCDRLEAG